MVDPLEAPIPAVSLDHIELIARDWFGIDGRATFLGGERDVNALIDAGSARYVVKIATEPRSAAFAQAALNHIRETDPSLGVPRTISPKGEGSSQTVEIDGVALHVSATTYLEGIPMVAGPISSGAGRAIGHAVARLQHAMRGFVLPSAARAIRWDARRADELLEWTPSIPDAATRALAVDALQSVSPLRRRLATLPAQIVHNDVNRGNLLVDPGDSMTIVGILDFGDMIHAPRVQDLAVAVTYAALAHPDPIRPAVAVVSGFCEVGTLESSEVDLIPELVSIRLAQSLTIAHHRASLHPDNAAYILSDTVAVGQLLAAWSRRDSREVVDRLHEAAGTPSPPKLSEDVARSRATSMWSGLRLMYDRPLHLVRGDGVWVDDAAGRRYLDAYNNVVQVGHGNRRVIAAASAQARQLNTNTRYLTDPVVRLAEAITSRLPDPLSVCFFVNSGTEANDLAWRIARTVSSNTGAVVTQHAYHGWTDATYALSPEERPAAEAPGSVATMAAPGVPGPDCEGAVDVLARAGHAPAAVWFDGTFSSDGIRIPPPGYFRAAADIVRGGGGLYIADEVQGGLGRVGIGYWAFATDDAVPDVVTLGKPLGNGYPIGVVVTTRAIADRFAETGYFFSTFGGNPVSAAAALKVLAITDELDLPIRADNVGALLRTELPAALAALPVDAVVRGRGAFVGIDMGNGDIARSFVEAMRNEGVLVSRTGPGATVVKIRPPLIFNTDHAERLSESAARAAIAVAQST